jgi:RHS repeat-associated protein
MHSLFLVRSFIACVRLVSGSASHLSRQRRIVRRLRAGCRVAFGNRPLRAFTCHAIILNLLIWPSPQVTFGAITFPVSGVASTIASTVADLSSIISSLRSAPVIVIPSAPIMIPFPALPFWPFNVQASRPISMAERTARVATIAVSPHRMVGYMGETVTFVAMGSDIRGDLVHGAKFQWESSDTNKLTIDEAGRATMLHPGMVIVTARAGAAAQAAPVLIRPVRRPVQTDQQWRADQESLVSSVGKGDNGSGVLASLMDRLLPTAHAQFNPWGDNPKAALPIGTPPFTSLEPTRLGPVMPGSNFELPLPIVSLGGRGLATSLMLYYNSSVWGAYVSGNNTVYAFDPIQSWPSPGFSLGFGRVTYYDGYYDSSLGDTMYKFMLIDPNGTHHLFQGVGSSSGNNTLQTTDGTHITYAGNALGGTLYFNDGTAVTIGKVNNRLLPTQITDTNGNDVQIAYHWEANFPPMAINYVVDTLGRVIEFNYDAYNSTNLTSITTPTGTVSLGYQTVTMNPNFLLSNPIENMPSSFSAVSSVTIPQRPTCAFTYSGYGMIYNIVATSAGGTAAVTYDYPQGGDQVLWPAFSHRTESGSPNAVYFYATDGSITRPDGTKMILSGPDAELRSTSNTTLSKTISTLTTDPGGSTALDSMIMYDEIAQQTKVAFDYDQYGNAVNKREYGYQISGAWKVRRRTHYSYVNWEPYLSAYIRNRVTETDVYDALQNTNDADDVLVGKTVVGYDSYSVMGGMENYGGTAAPPGHLSIYDTSKTTRGNPTGVTTYADLSGGGVTRSNKIDIFGGVTKAQVSCCNVKSFTKTEATYWTAPSETTSGDTSGVHLTSSASYDFNSLTTTSQTDPHNQTTSYSYDAAQRPTGFTSQTGASGSTAYNVFGEKTSSTMSYTEGGVNKNVSTSAVYDGWGQMTSSIDATGSQTNYAYDNMGHRLTQTNPFPQGGTPAPSSSYQHDQLSRVTVTTLPDGNTLQTAYTGGNIVQVTDQVSRKTKRESDSLGRLIKVTEQDVTTGNLTQETTYSYDIADHLIGVTQGNQARAFKYDAEGHLLFERIPEMTATINDGTGTYWTTKYTYTTFAAVATKTDARGVIITYGYDNLNRLTSISYNTSGATGVSPTNNVAYSYDTSQSSATNGLLLSITMNGQLATYAETFAYDDSKRLSSRNWTRDGQSYTISYQYNTGNQMTQMVYPTSGRTLNITHDSVGRVSQVADQYRAYISNCSFNSAGQVTGLSLGNVASETYGYDANRLQLIQQTATKTGGPSNGLMNLHYDYQASAGQMGAGSTPGNSGQLIAINNNSTISGTTESAAYTYDDLGRLVTSNQTSNASSAQRRFDYDRWGNRTGMWDATSGGAQIQSVTLTPSGGAPTNQITSVTVGKSTQNYIYDGNGNLTNDGTHTYEYDAENRVNSVDNGATATYAYDYQNRRIKKVAGGTSTHYFWERNQVIAEHDATTGGVIYNYVYLGTRLIARMGSGVINWYLSDRLSERLVVDASGSVIGRMAHLPFGEDFAESSTQEKHHFTSYESDSDGGTDYAVNRQYSQSVGRFMRVDPKAGSHENPQTLDRYSYVANDPIRLTDPLGLDPFMAPGLGSSFGWDLTWLFLWSGLFPGPDLNTAPANAGPSVPVDKIPPPPRCTAAMPTGETELAIVYTLMHEGTSAGRLGQHSYLPGETYGKATGSEITLATQGNEALLIVNAMMNYADSRHGGDLLAAILDDSYMTDGHRNAKKFYEYGKALAQLALNDFEGGYFCEKLGVAIMASSFWANGRDFETLPPSVMWWRAIIQGHWVRPGDDAYTRMADTDFLDHNPN